MIEELPMYLQCKEIQNSQKSRKNQDQFKNLQRHVYTAQ